jgi:hypothetical protein
MNKNELAEFVARLPEHLRFFFHPPTDESDKAEYVKAMGEHLARVRQFEKELLAHGVRADRFLAEAGPTIEAALKSQARIESLEDGLLHAHADSAEAQHKLYKAGGILLKELEEENPFAAGVEDLRELLDEMAEDFPKEE